MQCELDVLLQEDEQHATTYSPTFPAFNLLLNFTCKLAFAIDTDGMFEQTRSFRTWDITGITAGRLIGAAVEANESTPQLAGSVGQC